MATVTPSIQFIRTPHSNTEYLICDRRYCVILFATAVLCIDNCFNKKKIQMSIHVCRQQKIIYLFFTVYTKHGKFDGYGPGSKPAHKRTLPHFEWTSIEQDKNNLLVDMIDDITINDQPVHQTYTHHCVNNPEAAKAFQSYDKARKILYRAKAKAGSLPAPHSGHHASQLLSQSKFSRNYYGQQLSNIEVTDEELKQFDDVNNLNDRINALKMNKKKVNEDLRKCEQIKRIKFDDYKSKDSLLFLGGCEDSLFQVFAEKNTIQILCNCRAVFFDGSWGSTPLLSTKCKKRNYYRMSWDIHACFRNPKDEQTPFFVKCATILFAVDKPASALYERALRFLKLRCKEEFELELFECNGFELLIMADFEKPMRKAIKAVIIFVIIVGCWFHFCKCIVGKISDVGLLKLYKSKDDHTFYEFMRGFLMLALLPKDLIPVAFDILVQLGELNVSRGSKHKFKLFVDYMNYTWMNGLYRIDEWCVYGLWVRTNNLTESMNFVTSQLFGKHPIYQEWVKQLALQFAHSVVKYNQYKQWKETNRRKPKEIQKNKLLQNEWMRIAKDKSPQSIMLFLNRCSKTMKVSKETLATMNHVLYKSDK